MLGQKSDTPRKNASSTKNPDTELNKSKRTLVKGPKPLQKLKFYLDIKNHAVTSKLEGKIKELGGAVEFFLDREVTHVISDRPECAENSTGALNSPATPRLRSVESHYSNESPLSSCESPATGRLRQKTRADAMLEKVRSQSTAKVRDPLQNAKLWGIPIWTVNRVLSWLERVSASITVSTSKTKKVKVINIASPFIKFEPITRNARPVYKTIKTWPTIDLESKAGKPAFIVKSDQNQPQDQNNISESNQTDLKTTGKDQADQPGSTNDSRMTRKQRTRLSVRGGKEHEEKQTLVGGYCEICHCEYREIGEHVRSEQHLNFVKNDANFLELDSLITAGANVEAFLSMPPLTHDCLLQYRLNGNSGKDLSSNYGLFGRRSLRKLNEKDKERERCNGSLDPGYSPPVTRNKMPRTRSSNQSQHTPPPTHHLRSRGHICNSGEEQLPISKEETKTKDAASEGRPRRTCPKTKRISADERLVADNKTYYKVEVMTTKLRSSGLGAREVEVSRRAQTPIPEEPEETEEQSLVVKFKRVRRSELSVLNDEAENFMFPRKDDSSSEIDTDEGPETTQSTVKTDPSSDIRSSEPEKAVNDHEESLDAVETPRRKRKRTDTSSQEDSIETMSVDNFVNEIGLRRKARKVYTEIEDQFDESSKDDSLLEVGEIETRRSKRRNVGDHSLADIQRNQSIVTSTPIVIKTEPAMKNNGDCTTKVKDEDQALETQAEDIKKELHREDLKYSFELLPKSEPWYSTFRRQDNGEEFYTSVSDPANYCARFMLPYQLPFLIPLDPKVCIEDYLKKKRVYLNPAGDDEPTAGTSEVFIGEDSNSLASIGTDSIDGSFVSSSTETQKLEVKPGPGRRRKRKSRFIKLGGSMHPRKSPRQHASTLAILSSLIQQRKKRERKSHGESDTSRASLITITEENSLNISTISLEEQKIQEQNAAELAKVVEDILSAPMDDISEPELDSFEAVEIKHHPDAIELLQNFDKLESPPRGYRRKKFTSLGETGKLVRRKRKKNRTGWPKKKRLFVKRGPKSEDGNCSLPELEDSRLTEISLEEENGELEMCELEVEGALDTTDEAVENRTNETVNSENKVSESEKEGTSGETNCEYEMSKLDGVVKPEPEQILVGNTIQGDLQCTEQLTNSVKLEPSEVESLETNSIEKLNNVLVENINNNSFSDIKIKGECVSYPPSNEQKCAPELNNGLPEETPPRTPYNVTILDCKKPQLKRNQRNSSSDCSGAEEVIASQNERLGSCVNVTLDKWENAEKVLTAKVQENEQGKLIQFQPFVRVQKIENSNSALQNANRRLRSSSSPERKPKPKRAKIVPPTSPRSPRKLRTPRGKWYRER